MAPTSSTLSADGGELSVKGRFNPREQSYDAAIRADSFPLNSFLPADSLGIVDLALQARGTGFDPLLPRTRTSLRAQIDRAEFGGRDFGGIELDAELDSQRLSGRISDRDEALRLLLSVSGTLTEREQRIGLSGSVFGFDLAALGVSPEPISGSFALDASASAAGKPSMRSNSSASVIPNVPGASSVIFSSVMSPPATANFSSSS